MSSHLGFLWRIAAATTLLVIASSMTMPVLAVLLQKRGLSATAIGSFAMISFSTIALLIPIMPTLFARFGIVRLYRLGMVLNLGGLVVYSLTDTIAIWCLAAVVGGAGGACIWNASEALLARYAPADRRGQVTGLYQTALGAALAAGPLLPALLGLSSQQALLLAIAIMALAFAVAMAPLPATPTQAPTSGDNRTLSTWGAIKLVPALCVIAFAGGVFEAGLNAISAAHGSRIGLSLAASASIVGAIGTGSFIAQYPAGIMSDRIGNRRVFGTASVVLLCSSLLLAASLLMQPLLWVAAFIWGAVGGALYTLTMITVAHRFSGTQTAAGTAAMITGYTLGGAIGPATSGLLLDIWGVAGIAGWLALLSVAVMVAARRQ